MQVEQFVDVLGAEFYTGVPDSQLKALCNYLMNSCGTDGKHHIIAANEGNCVGIAAGYYLATEKIPVVYLQNSGEGNIINPVASLLNENVYAIPMIFVIGWRGEPGIHDEPQHIFQGQVTIKLLEDMGISSFVVGKETTLNELQEVKVVFDKELEKGRQVAFIIRKDALIYEKKINYSNSNVLTREEIIKRIVSVAGEDPIISTTGKASRELFEIREQNRQSHNHDFLTVGSMGHSSSIALGVAINKPDRKVWCIDGDGAVLMHMGAMATIGTSGIRNMVHIVINNGSHESVGGLPTVGANIDLVKIAKGCGYTNVVCVNDLNTLDGELIRAKKKNELSFVEVKAAIGSRPDLGRPTESTYDNKNNFISTLRLPKD